MATTPEAAALLAQMSALTDSMRKLITAQSQVTNETYKQHAAVVDATVELDHYEAALKKHGKLTVEEEKLQRRLLAAKKQEVELISKLKKEQLDLAKTREQFKKGEIDLTEYRKRRKTGIDAAASTKADIAKNKSVIAGLETSFGKLSKSVSGAAKHFDFLIGFLATVGGSLLNFNKVFLDATHRSAGVIEESTGNFDQGMGHWLATLAATGVEAGRVLELMAGNRQLVNSLGGIRAAIDLTEDSILEMRGFYGSLEESMKENLAISTNLINKGFKPTQATLKSYNKDLEMLAKQTGIGAAQLNTMIESVASDVDSLTILRAAREDERAAILANQRALLRANIALGMNAEQAEAAAKMLNKMVAQKPLERLKQAAKVRAMGAAMGLGSEAEKAAEAITAGKRATAEQMTNLNDFNIKMTGIADQAAQQGLGQELFVSTVLDKLDLNQYYGEGSPFSTTLGVALAQNQDKVAEMYKSSTDSTIVAINNVADIAGEMLKALLNGQMIWGALLDLTRIINQKTIEAQLAANTAKGASYQAVVNTVGKFSDSTAQEYNAKIEKLLKERGELEKMLPGTPTAKPAAELEREADARIKKKEDERQAKSARPITPGEAAEITVKPDPIKEGVEAANATKSDEHQRNHTTLLTDQGNKIDAQLKQMTTSNEYLKIIADTNPKLVELAEKQLAMTAMSQEQRDRMASRLSSENAKFSADYSYAI